MAGRWRDASGPACDTEYPADGSLAATRQAATAPDVDEAVQAAEQARRQLAWTGLKRHEGAGMLQRIAGIGADQRHGPARAYATAAP